MRVWLLILALGCDQGVAPKRTPLPPPADPSRPSLIVRDVPPPPPPPSEPSPQPPPQPIATFLRQHAHTPGPWRVTLRDGTRRVELPSDVANDFVARLALDRSYNDGDIGCVGDEVGVRIMRGEGQLEFVYDCGHVYLDEAKHDGAWVLFSAEMVEYFEQLRATKRT